MPILLTAYAYNVYMLNEPQIPFDSSGFFLTSNSYARMEELKGRCLPCLLLLITENLLTVRTYKDKKQHISRRFMVHWQTQTASLPSPTSSYPIVGNISAALRLIYIFEWVVYKNATKLVCAWCPCPSAPILGAAGQCTHSLIYTSPLNECPSAPKKWVKWKVSVFCPSQFGRHRRRCCCVILL